MHIISRKALRDFWEIHPAAKAPLEAWFRVARQASWKKLLDVQAVYRDAEAVGNFTVFNIKGNSYRLVVSIDYEKGVIFVKYVMTHAEYDRNRWKNDPRF